ncbi:MAG: hypothetical protein SW833_14810 [Cyanobacteriota bacterium]|nr:hypothetical protein [Cyanobacteriota bacterium]
MSAEDQIIAKIQLHRDIKNLVIEELRQAGIECQETKFTDSKGDILIINPIDVDRVRETIKEIQQRSNP